MYQIPFNQTTFRPKSIPGNDTADKPVEFTLSQIGGADLMRLRGLIYATTGFAHLRLWNKDVNANVIDAFREAPTFFARGIDAIANLSVPYAMALKSGFAPDVKHGDEPPESVAVKTGQQFAAVSGHVIPLSFEVAMEIARLSTESEIDTRFFDLVSGSPGSKASPSGTAHRAPKPRKRGGTAGGGPAAVN